MNFNTTSTFFVANIKVDMTIDEPTVVYIPEEFWYKDGYYYDVVELQGEVRKDVQNEQSFDGNNLLVKVT
jgi:hypothetical protein